MDDLRLDYLLLTVGALALLGMVAVCLSGLYKSWADDPRVPAAILAFLPGSGLVLLVLGIAGLLEIGLQRIWLLLVVIAALTVVAFVITVLEPSWWGPRWYRRRLGIGAKRDTWSDGSRSQRAPKAVAGDLSYRPGSLLMRALGEDEPVDRWQATLIQDFHAETGLAGRLWLYPEGLSFVETMPVGRPREHGQLAIEMLAPEIAEIRLGYQVEMLGPGEKGSIQRFRPESPWLMVRLREPTNVGELQIFRLSHPAATARRISEVLGCPVEEMR